MSDRLTRIALVNPDRYVFFALHHSLCDFTDATLSFIGARYISITDAL